MLHVHPLSKLTPVAIYLSTHLRNIIFRKGEDIFTYTFFIGFFPIYVMNYLVITVLVDRKSLFYHRLSLLNCYLNLQIFTQEKFLQMLKFRRIEYHSINFIVIKYQNLDIPR